MRVLVACEFSGIVRDAFAAKGHDAWSCDLLPSERPGKHYQDDVLLILDRGWDLLIAHPPCTYLSYAATAYWDQPGREEKRNDAMDFFMRMYFSPIKKVCVENPVGYPNVVFRKPDQIIHPWFFGDADKKRTCLWLKNLPKLVFTKKENLFHSQTATIEPEPIYTDKSGKKRYLTDAISGTNGGGHKRSVSFKSIAEAMADQWT